MIKITNRIKEFIDDKGDLFIWGGGNIGEITGRYMNKCGISYEGYIDSNVKNSEITLNEHKIFNAREIKDWSKEKQYRVIVASGQFESIVFDISNLASKYELIILCYIPIYEKRSFAKEKGVEVYNVNRMLGFFRRKLLNVDDFPTVISNDCFAGRIYDAFDAINMITITPTINTWIDIEDFLKLSSNPKHYLQIEMKEYIWRKVWIHEVIAGKLDDIYINFAHSEGTDAGWLMDRWNYMCEKVKWDNMLFVVRENEALPYEFTRQFSLIEYPNIIFRRKYLSKDDIKSNSVFAPEMINNPNAPIENHFDILGLFNRLLKNK